jgi:hypothetical protein
MQTPIEAGAAMNEKERTRVAAAGADDESPEPGPHVVVGVSASHSGLAALRVAVREAVARDAPLHVVRVWTDLSGLFSMTAADIMDLRDRQRADGLVLAEAVEIAHLMAPRLQVVPAFVAGDLYAGLQARTDGAALMVVGTGDDPTTAGLTGDWLHDYAPCPVVIVDADERAVHGQETHSRDASAGGDLLLTSAWA